MSAVTCPESPDIGESETCNGAISFLGLLDSGELLSGTPTVVELTSSDLTITNVKINTVALTIRGISNAVGQAVQFSFSGQSANTSYRLKATASTDATPAQTRVAICPFRGVTDTA